jgi:DNA polymerase I
LYGTIGWTKFFLYDRDTAEAVTMAGQAVVKASGTFVDENTEADVIYGDTDSNYISFPTNWTPQRCIEECIEICERLEEDVYPPLAESMNVPREACEWRIEPEMLASRFLQWGKKKKYAYLAIWKEGMEPDETMDQPAKTIKGSAAKRSDSSRLTRDTEKDCITAILHGRRDERNDIVDNAATSLDAADPDWDRIGIPGGIGQAFSEYEKPTAHVEAAQNANTLLDTEFGKGSKPMRVYLQPAYFEELGKKTDRIAYESSEDLLPVVDRLTIDASRMTDTLLVNPIGEMLDSVGIDVDAAVSGQTQSGLGAFS